MSGPLISGAAETLKRSLGTFVTRIRRIVRNSIICRELIFLTLKVVVRWTAKGVVPKAGRYHRATLLVTHYGAFAGRDDASCFYTVRLWGGDAVDSHYLWDGSQLWPDP